MTVTYDEVFRIAYTDTVRCRYNAHNFLEKPQNWHFLDQVPAQYGIRRHIPWNWLLILHINLRGAWAALVAGRLSNSRTYQFSNHSHNLCRLCLFIINRTIGNKLQWNLNKISTVFIRENSIQIVSAICRLFWLGPDLLTPDNRYKIFRISFDERLN